MDFACISDATQNANAQAVLSSDQEWIAITDSADEDTWVCATTNKIANYTNWNDGEPNDSNADEDCAEIDRSTGQWNDYGCTETQPCLCSGPS